MQRLIQFRREIFSLLLATFLLTSACMLSQVETIHKKGVTGFSILQLELPDSAATLAATVQLLKDNNAISDLRSNLRTDYIFMHAAYLGIVVWLLCLCIQARSTLRVVLKIFAALQLIPLLLDINENNCLLNYINTGSFDMDLSVFKTLVRVKFAIAFAGAGLAIIVLILRLFFPRLLLSDQSLIPSGESMFTVWRPFPDYRIAKLSAVGFIGLLVGFLILSWHDITRPQKGKPPLSNFHEINYQPRVIVAGAFNKLINKLDSNLKLTRDSVNAKMGSDAKLAQWKKKINEDSTFVNTLTGYKRYYEDASPVDSQSFAELNKLLHFNITIDTLRKWDSAYTYVSGDKWQDTARFWIKLPGTPPQTIYTDTTRFSISRPWSDTEFGARYPAVGLWILFLLAFCSFCFIAISVSLYFKNRVLAIFYPLDLKGPSRNSFYLIWAFTLIAFICMMFIWRRSFNDEVMIKPIFFMQGFNSAMKGMMFIGYVAGACCLAGFFHTASMLGFFAREINKKTTGSTGNELSDEDKKNLAIYNKLKKYFDNYLLLAASILSLLVLCTGTLFSTVNSLNFIKLLSDDWGYSLARPDYIYLYGALHSVILLLAYIPASFSFSEIELKRPATATPEEKRSWQDILKNPMSRLGDIVIAASPLLTGVLQSLFETMFK